MAHIPIHAVTSMPPLQPHQYLTSWDQWDQWALDIDLQLYHHKLHIIMNALTTSEDTGVYYDEDESDEEHGSDIDSRLCTELVFPG